MRKINDLQQYLVEKDFSQIFLLVDENTSTHCLPILLEKVDEISDKQAILLEIPSGEENKTLATVENICTSLLESNADRNSVLISLGGGVITDIGGFVASIYKRGIQNINIPTTLLAMIDASIGGKTGVDLCGVKNSIGTFNNNTISFLDTEFLGTLDKREIMNGVAEMLKTFLVADKDYTEKLIGKKTFDTIEDDFIWRCIKIKETIVEQDFHDKDARKVLNFGHTLGHAFESCFLQEQKLLHGEAVAIGMYYALKLSEIKQRNKNLFLENIFLFLEKNFVILDLHKNLPALLPFVKNDKKAFKDVVYFVLLKDIGVPVINVPVDLDKDLASINCNNL
ncbi:MAG: 3-dehydroquinate synthase [Bacteroidales bacterium]|nr:3-dehydroquinate synthase [Bacteroidales bacterium]